VTVELTRGAGAGPYDFRVALVTRTPRAWVVPSLVGINIAVLAAMAVAGVDPWSPSSDQLLRWGANYAPLNSRGHWWRFVTAMFVHGGALHLCMNMLVLLQIGPLVERLLGNRAFALAYLVSGACASVASIAWNSYAISVGASGAILGVFGVLVVYLARYGESIPADVSVPLYKNVVIFIALNVAVGVLVDRVDFA
jgi:rhomboid protease GluP